MSLKKLKQSIMKRIFSVINNGTHVILDFEHILLKNSLNVLSSIECTNVKCATG